MAGDAGYRCMAGKSKETAALWSKIFDHLDNLSSFYRLLDSALLEALQRNGKTREVRNVLKLIGIIETVPDLDTTDECQGQPGQGSSGQVQPCQGHCCEAAAANGAVSSQGQPTTEPPQEGQVIPMQPIPEQPKFGMQSMTRLQNFLIEAMKIDSVGTAQLLLEEVLDLSQLDEKLSLSRLNRLFSGKKGMERETLRTYRGRLQDYLERLPVFPLACPGQDCERCETNIDKDGYSCTCLDTKQEFFLWCLDNQRIKMALLFLPYCKDTAAAALFAEALFRGMAGMKRYVDEKKPFDEHAKCFQEVAVQILNSCNEMNEAATETLLTKPCEWWGGVSVLQLAIITENKAFLAQSACQKLLTHIWRGDQPQCRRSPDDRRPYRFLDIGQDIPCWDANIWNCLAPKKKYFVHLFLRVCFLLLFSYEMLSEFNYSLSPTFICLIVAMFAITVEEFRQMLGSSSLLSNTPGLANRKAEPWKRAKAYLSVWKAMDIAAISVFWLGMVAFAPVEELQATGRVLLSFDLFFFFVRMFQMLMVFKSLGFLLVMIINMVWDTASFMMILLVFVVGYAVASEALLYPETAITALRLFHMPSKAFWQIFGELFLDDLDPSGEKCLSANSTATLGDSLPSCPTSYGLYIVPVFKGFYIMITNVLLLNLLIARFGKTFDNVYDSAGEHQAWLRSKSIEFYHSDFFPPPFNIITGIVDIIRKVWPQQQRCQSGADYDAVNQKDACRNYCDVRKLEKSQTKWVLLKMDKN